MTNYSIQNQLPVFLSATGAALNAGKVYIGLPNQDPQTFPKAVYWNQAGTDPVDQTNGIDVIGGYITRAGSPATIYISGSYSVRVRDRFGVQVYYIPEVNDDIVDLTAQLLTTAGAGMIGYSLAATYPAGTVGKKLQQTINPLDAPYSATGDGVADDRTALAAADAAAYAAGRPLYITGNHRVSSDLTLQSDLFFVGGKLTVDSGKTVTCRGEVSAPTQQVFAGAGTVVGIRRVRPEWFGAVGNGTADDSDALNACNACVLQSATSRGPGRPSILYSDVVYGLAKTHRVTPTADINTGVVGAGGALGTRFRALASWTDINGAMAFHLDCVSGSVTTDYTLESFTMDREGGSSCAIGLYLGPAAAGKAINSLQACRVENVCVIDFPVCWQLNQIRQIRTPGCSAWCDNTSGAVGIKISCLDSTFTGDFDFEDFQIVGATATGGNNIMIENGTGTIRGLRFKEVISYHANIHVNINITGTGAEACGDFWFSDGCQFDGYSNNIFNITVAAGSVLNDLTVGQVQARGINAGGNFFTSNATSTSLCNSWKIEGADIIDAQCGSRPLFEFHGAHTDISIINCSVTNVSSTTHYIAFYDFAELITIAHNRGFKPGSRQAVGWAVLSATANRYTVIGNMATSGTFTGTIVSELNGAATKYVPAGSNF
ncbi:hypothetical protein [Sphingobium sp. YC-XJ3]|uniref:hypothetical protein n=1 Tax=Sphingobium sp. YC-XJ3 TaxID=3024245 RepID=UPI00235F9F9D|nr:hypothetical protein [Sphingobium sp. YC-XJ3]WDA36396.1 hypothetical protein PO876_23705 [Sphingobium sp. YC-XJ3]